MHEPRIELPPLLTERASLWGGAAGRAWLDALPAVLEQLVERWRIVDVGAPYPSGASFVAPVVAAGGVRGVVKVPMRGVDLPYPHGNVRHGEAAALRVWAGDGAVALLDEDEETGSMLIERCEPGARLASSVTLEEADDVAAALLPRLWRQVPDGVGIPTVDDLATQVVERAERNYASCDPPPCERVLLDDALRLLDEVRATRAERVLLHGDFHHANVLTAGREPWLAIDPLPLVGERAVDAVMFLMFRKGSMTDPARDWERSIVRFCRLVGVDVERAKAWMFVRLVSDALVGVTIGLSVAQLEAFQEDLWSARLLRSFL
ncbi:MAG TPA: aminoglycoside phosphotransferase family protein [Acidimicrobiales bacterium]